MNKYSVLYSLSFVHNASRQHIIGLYDCSPSGLRGIYGRFDSKIRFENESDGRFDSRFDSNEKNDSQVPSIDPRSVTRGLFPLTYEPVRGYT